MVRALRFLGVGVLLCLFAARVDAASVTLAWDPNSETNLRAYLVGYRTSPSGTETIVDVGMVTTWTLTSAAPGSTYYFRVYAENTSFLRSAPSNEVSTTIPTTPPPPTGGGYALDRGLLSYGAVKSGSTVTSNTPAQTLMVTRTSGTASFTVTSSNSWLKVTPASGSGTAPLTVSIAAGSLSPGTYTGTVTVKVGSTNLPVQVSAKVFAAGATTAPGGYFDTPTDGVVNVAGAIPVTGWAVDDVGVSKVDIYRDPAPGEPNTQIYVGSASFISGSRPDIESMFPQSPLNYRAGWGFLVLTNMLPDLTNGKSVGGNGNFRLHAYAIDVEGNSTYLGAKRFNANNAASVKPFGSIDTPAQGGTASGNGYVVFGWALSPRGSIPTNGSTITAFVDGSPVGHPTYNNNRSDIATLFPGYANSNGAIGYHILNTQSMSNGLHTISWVVTDNLGNSEGIGSRFFTVSNTGSAATAAATAAASAAVATSTVSAGTHGEALGQSVETVADVPADYSIVEVKKAASEAPPEVVLPEWTGEIRVETKETEQVEIHLANQFSDSNGGTYQGYVVVGGRMRPLPVGSSLDTEHGVFTWQPGPGFIGNYEFIFIRKGDGWKTRIPVHLRIAPKFDRDDK
jgi:hypothetical protein